LNERRNVHLAYRSERSAARNRVLARSASPSPNLTNRQAIRQALLRDRIGVQRRKRKGPVEIGSSETILQVAPDAEADLEEVNSVRQRGIVLKFVVILVVIGLANRGSAACKESSTVIAGIPLMPFWSVLLPCHWKRDSLIAFAPITQVPTMLAF